MVVDSVEEFGTVESRDLIVLMYFLVTVCGVVLV